MPHWRTILINDVLPGAIALAIALVASLSLMWAAADRYDVGCPRTHTEATNGK